MPGIVDFAATLTVPLSATAAQSAIGVRGLQAFTIAVPTGVGSCALQLQGAFDPRSNFYPVVDPQQAATGTVWSFGCATGSCAVTIWPVALGFPFLRPVLTVIQSVAQTLEIFGLRR